MLGSDFDPAHDRLNEIRQIYGSNAPGNGDNAASSARASPEAVAYDLMRDILFEDVDKPAANSKEFRGYLLDLYSECLDTVYGRRITAPRVVPLSQSEKKPAPQDTSETENAVADKGKPKDAAKDADKDAEKKNAPATAKGATANAA